MSTLRRPPKKADLMDDLLHNAQQLVRLYDAGEDIKPVVNATRECLKLLKTKAKRK